MPAKTIYVKDADLTLFEQAQEQLGDSVSSMFSEFLRERVANLNPVEGRIMHLIEDIASKRDAVKKQRGIPEFVAAQYAESEGHAEKALKNLRRGRVRDAKISFWAANAYLELADRDFKHTRDLVEKIGEMTAAGEKSQGD